jgi:hypothetical protein
VSRADRDSNEVHVNGKVNDVHLKIYKRVAARMTGEWRERQACITRTDRIRLKQKKALKRRKKSAARLGAR